jgi:endo-1,3(4)-beta-glucanase
MSRETSDEDQKLAQLANDRLKMLKTNFLKVTRNAVTHPLFYDDYWNGILSSLPFEKKNVGHCYCNAIYNDHMFHYGYLVYTAALIVHMEPSFLDERGVKDFINHLIRDYANPVDDAYYPFSRNFDWWHGHSWAAGLDVGSDGKNLESTSEDAMGLLAIKLWGKVTGDKGMEARGNLQLAILRRSLRLYFLWETGNDIQLANKFIDYKVTGIVSLIFRILCTQGLTILDVR